MHILSTIPVELAAYTYVSCHDTNPQTTALRHAYRDASRSQRMRIILLQRSPVPMAGPRSRYRITSHTTKEEISIEYL